MDIKDSPEDYADLKRAVALLESPSITARLSDFVGSPIESLVKKLPRRAQGQIQSMAAAALQKAAGAALWSLENSPKTKASTKMHKAMAALSGMIGGFFGLPALPVELPVSTTIIMRAVADIARSEGFDLENAETKQSCIEVFALGGPSDKDDATESGYYVMRAFSAEAMRHLSKELVEIASRQGAQVINITSSQAGRWLAKFIEKVATRFGIVITEKAAAQAVPVIGAIAGGGLNALFTDFYQDMARGHFIIKRLEKKYGFEKVRFAFVQVGPGAPILSEA